MLKYIRYKLFYIKEMNHQKINKVNALMQTDQFRIFRIIFLKGEYFGKIIITAHQIEKRKWRFQ